MCKILQDIRLDQQTDMVEVCFRMRSDDLQPSVITDELGIEPAWSFAKGESYTGRSLIPETKEIICVQRQRPWGIWAIDTKLLVKEKKVHKHIVYLLNMLEPKTEKLVKYLEQNEKYQISFTIQWSPVEGFFGSYEINSQILMRMSKLSHYIEFSFLGKTGE